MLDQIESWENAAEKWADENIKGDKFKCSCGEWEFLDNAQAIDPNPYSIPVCNKCFDEWYKANKKD